MSWRGILSGALALVALQVAVSQGTSSRLGQLLELPGHWAVRFLSPDVPAIPDRAAAPGVASVGGLTGQPKTYPSPDLVPGSN